LNTCLFRARFGPNDQIRKITFEDENYKYDNQYEVIDM
jgi:hypothetical protein